MSLETVVAIELGPRAMDLAALLRFARVRGSFGFVDAALESLALRALAADRGVEVSAEELQEESDAFRGANRLAAVEDMQAWLAERGVGLEDLSDFEAMLEERVLRRKLCAAIPRDAVERQFTLQRGELDVARIARIVVGAESVAEEVRAQAEEGEEFGALARAHSTDVTAPAGGYVGEVGRADLSRSLADDVFAAEAGAIVGPVRGDAGWVVVQVVSLTRATLDEATADGLRAEILQAALAAQVRSARRPLLDLL